MKQLKTIRLKTGLTQKQLAKAAGVQQPFISQIERDLKQPSIERTKAIANALGVTVGELLGEKVIRKK